METNSPPARGSNIEIGSASSHVATDLMPRRFKNYIVSERELSTLGFMSALGTLVVTFFGVTAGAAIALWVTLKTVSITDPTTNAAFWAAFLVSLIFAALLGGASVLMCIRAVGDVNRIKQESEQEKRRKEGAA